MAGQTSIDNGKKHVATVNSPAAIRMRKIIEEVAERRFEEMIEAQMDSAIGITSEKHDKKTGDLYYVEEGPNTAAAKLILDQVIPKVTEVKHTGGIGVLHLIKSLSDPQEEESYGTE